jgi:hypothetical protein
MAEPGIDLRREGLLEVLDFFGDFAEADRVAIGIAAALFVSDDGEALAEGGGEIVSEGETGGALAPASAPNVC